MNRSWQPLATAPHDQFILVLLKVEGGGFDTITVKWTGGDHAWLSYDECEPIHSDWIAGWWPIPDMPEAMS